MKNNQIIIMLVIINLIYLCSCNRRSNKDALEFALSVDCINDSIPQVKIGNQTWTTKNLDFCAFKNGDQILQVKNEEEMKAAADEEKPCWCYRNFDSSYNHLYGKLYNWYAVIDPRGLAPVGYSIPSLEDYEKLCKTLGGKSIAGKKMKAKCGWRNSGLNESIQDISDNESGFSALPGRYFSNSFLDLLDDGVAANYWTSSEPSFARSDLEAYCVELNSGTDFFWLGFGNQHDKRAFMPVRCVKN